MTFPSRIIEPLRNANLGFHESVTSLSELAQSKPKGFTPEQTIESVPWSLRVDP